MQLYCTALVSGMILTNRYIVCVVAGRGRGGGFRRSVQTNGVLRNFRRQENMTIAG